MERWQRLRKKKGVVDSGSDDYSSDSKDYSDYVPESGTDGMNGTCFNAGVRALCDMVCSAGEKKPPPWIYRVCAVIVNLEDSQLKNALSGSRFNGLKYAKRLLARCDLAFCRFAEPSRKAWEVVVASL